MTSHSALNPQHSAPLWPSLVVAAALGTERRPPPLSGADGALSELLAALGESGDPEGALLGAAAAVSLGLRAGRLPAPGDPSEAIPACAPDDLPECPPTAAQHLALMLRGQHRPALPEWLDALASAGYRAPAALLPELLELGRGQVALRPAILPALGRRGAWLASLNSAWEYASAELEVLSTESAPSALSTQRSALSTWSTAPRPARLAMLRALLASDRGLAHELVRSTWAQERAADRAALLAELRAGLCAADEPLLEGALDDRSAEVRAAAAELLSRLPGSALIQRMAERMAPLLHWVPAEPARMLGLRPGRPPSIAVALPEACDKAMARDGVEPKPHAQTIGERAWWLSQMLAAVPPSTWGDAWQAEPDAIVRAALRHEHADALLSGWWSAVERHPDPAWAEALLTHAADRPLVRITAGALPMGALAAQLPPERFERFALASLAAGGAGASTVVACDRPWSLALARAVLAALQEGVRRKERNVWRDGHLLHAIGQRAPVALLTEIGRGWPRDAAHWPQWEGYVAQCAELLEFRRTMLNALQGS
ncbi:MAG: hypothetical protein RLZZ387_2889 [Chloroflexota bacterium]